MPPERGVLKVLLCLTTHMLGVSAFPWDNAHGTMFDYRTLPGGGMRKYEEGKTMVHEFGHYLGLYHTFEKGCADQGDRIDDTNPEALPFFGCPSKTDVPPTSCADELFDPVHSFMDYTDDRCMCSFCREQAARL